MTYSTFKLFAEQETGLILTPEYQFAPPRKWRFDFACPGKSIAIEIEGGVWVNSRHVRGSGYIKDMEKYNTAAVMGWKVLRFTPDQLMTNKTIETIKSAL